ncbi:hypothetical protein D6B98_24790 [Bradyrhizobium sp. LVM 105]|nr:hypothetical protein D6B98_24790 [Bradyrhizobium sp. LVM 105]
MINAIYRYMYFSAFLVVVGLSMEFGKQWAELQKAKPTVEVEQLAKDAPDEMWYDVLRATRRRLFGEAMPREFVRGGPRPDGVYQVDVVLQSGECRDYLAMARPPALIDVEIQGMANEVVNTQLGKQDHLVFGRLCKAKSPTPSVSVKIVMKFLKGGGVHALETYSAPGAF